MAQALVVAKNDVYHLKEIATRFAGAFMAVAVLRVLAAQPLRLLT